MNFDHLFQQFSQLKVGVIGDVMLDTYWWGKVDRISPEAPVPVVAVSNKEERIGGAANVALNLQA
jgi:bifunctional ADP-heptose synthase (sugar kinase/adenylyltransferase)